MESLYAALLEHDSELHKSIAPAKNIKLLSLDFKLEINVNKSAHAEERQKRHPEEDGGEITDDDILNIITAASSKIIDGIINNKICMRGRFVIRDPQTKLNVVIQLRPGKVVNRINVNVITVFRSEKFWNTKDNWVILVGEKNMEKENDK